MELFLAKEANIFKIIVQNCAWKCDISRSGKSEFQTFPGEHAPGPPRGPNKNFFAARKFFWDMLCSSRNQGWIRAWALLDFDDGCVLWLLGFDTDSNATYMTSINAIWESYCCSLSLGFDSELDNFIVCLPARVCQGWFSHWFIVLYMHSWLLEVFENLVNLFRGFKKCLDRSTYSKDQTVSH